MSIFSSIGKVLKGAVKTVVNVGGQILGGIASPASALGLPSNVMGLGRSVAAPGVLPWKGPTPIATPVLPGGSPAAGGGFLSQASDFLRAQGLGPSLGAVAGGVAGRPGARMKRGRLTGNAIPAGFQERMSKSGVVYLAKLGRRRGITGRDLAAFRRVSRLLTHIRQPSFHRRRK